VNFAQDYLITDGAYEDLVVREPKWLTSVIPPDDLSIQWDVFGRSMSGYC
jgi:hypothetical protein